jgi:hypothetical protein
MAEQEKSVGEGWMQLYRKLLGLSQCDWSLPIIPRGWRVSAAAQLLEKKDVIATTGSGKSFRYQLENLFIAYRN